MRECNGCKFCCWSFNVEDIPHKARSLKVLNFKPEQTHCWHECARGCALHGTFFQPPICHDFQCPYTSSEEDIYRPDTFQALIEELGGNMGNYIPMVPTTISVADARQLITKSRTIPAAFFCNGDWMKAIIPLDRNEDGSWVTTELMLDIWNL